MNIKTLKYFESYFKDCVDNSIPIKNSTINEMYYKIKLTSGTDISLLHLYRISNLYRMKLKFRYNVYTKQYDLPMNNDINNKDPYKNESKLDKTIRLMNNRLNSVLNENFNDTDFILEFLRDDRIDVTMRDNSAIKWAIEYNNLIVFKYLISLECVIDSVNFGVLLKLACKYDAIEIVKILIEDFNVDVTTSNHIRIVRAIRQNKVELFNVLISSPKFKIIKCINVLLYSSIASYNNTVLNIIFNIDGFNLLHPRYDLINYAINFENKYAIKKLLRNDNIRKTMTTITIDRLIKNKYMPVYNKRKITI